MKINVDSSNQNFIKNNICSNKGETLLCNLDWACENCLSNSLVCPNCRRVIPNSNHLFKNGCKWCIYE